ncbi:MAG: hypothetical protein ACMZ7B_11715 [Balneola sp.]
MKNQLPTPEHSSLIDLLNDVSASLAFSALVTDAAGAAVIHVDGSTTNQLVISITNQTSGDITFAQLKGSASSGNCNLVLKLPNNQLYFYNAPAIDGASTPGSWVLATDSASGGAGWVDTIYLANTGTCKLTANGTAGDTLSVVINYSGAVPDDPKALNIPVQLSYLNITNASGTPLKGTTPAQTMGLMANAGRPSPLVGSFVGTQAVLNDGTTQHELTLRMVNTSLDPLQFIVPPSGSPTQSYIEVAVPVSDVAADAVWALCDSAAWGSVTVAMAGSASKGWKASKSATTDGVITLEPDFSTVQNIPPGGTLELQLSGVVSGLEPGVVQVQVELNRFALIGTQTFGAALEKSPLVYNNGLGTGMTLSAGTLGANTALNVSGDSSGALTHITQSGSGPALQVDGGDVNLSNSLSANSATISESVRINGPSSSSSDPSLSLGGHGNFNIDSDGTTAGRFTVQDGGNVGINNPSPSTTLDVTGDAKISGTVSANSISSNSATVSGALNAGSAAVSGATSTDSLTANSAIVNGNATIQGDLQLSGAFNLPGNIQALTPGSFKSPAVFHAQTYGFVICNILQSSKITDCCDCLGWGQVGSMNMYTHGGNTGTFGPGWSDCMSPNPTSFTMPVPSGATFYIGIYQNKVGQQADAPYNFWWVSLGAGGASSSIIELDKIGPEFIQPIIPENKVVKDSFNQSLDFITKLENAFGKKLDFDVKTELASLLKEI